jgi:ATP-dependent Clp endopeptidase proteolytic subunit ClpP
MQIQDKYFRAYYDKEGNTGELYLYGYIGQKADPFYGEDPEEDITDKAVVKAIRELEKQTGRINIHINSPGGSVMHGDPIITAIRNSKAEIHTYVDGIAASMAFDIWAAAKNRHASINSKLMIHATGGFAFGTAKDMRAAADMLDKFDQSAISTFAAATGMSEDEIRGKFYDDYADHWMTAKDALEMGLIIEIEDYETALPVQNPEKYSYRQLLEHATKYYTDGQQAKTQDAEKAEREKIKKESWREDYLRRLTHLMNLSK